MTIVDWAHVVLPLAALVFGTYLSIRYAETIDQWVKKLDEIVGRKS